MKFITFEKLIDKINEDLADFKSEFAYKRKELADLKKAPNRNVFFKYTNSDRDWAINEGGGTEIQYHLFYRNNTIGYGLGFNAQYVPFANDMSPVAYIKPFVSAYLNLLKQKNPTIKKLKNDGFSFIEGEEKDLNSIQHDDYYLFGKEIIIDSSNNISDNDYNQMIDYLKNDIYKLYVDIWEEKIKATKTNENMVNAMNLLTANHNLILTGAPGTGKTYLAKQIAQQIIFGEIKEKMSSDEEKQFNEQCGFVQFHPSYNYTDFVEGLRPVQDEAGNVGFERKDGIFKAFCKKAVSLPKNDTIDNFNETWDKLVATLNENNYIDVPFLSNKSKSFRVELNEYGTGLANRTYPNNTYEQGGWISGQSKFFSKDQLYNIYRGLSGVPSGGHDNYRRAIVEEMKKSLGLKPYKEGNSVEKSDKNFVFIIDEINRGEISKIFGELFFSIDPGYRGKEKGKIKTQYQNLIEQVDVFYDGFYVPENVYIIGTMNDIDRSVESMDFAFRRRFAFKEIKAKDTQTMFDDEKAWGKDSTGNYSLRPASEIIKDIKKRMNSLNNTIWDEENKTGLEGLSSAYHIGASYFLKLANYRNESGEYVDKSFTDLWDNHLEGLLREYMRGMQDVETKIDKLKKAYGYPSNSNND